MARGVKAARSCFDSDCEAVRLPSLADHLRRCELYGLPDDVARQRFRDFMAQRNAPGAAAFPGEAFAVSNVPVRVPTHFMGRDDALAAIDTALKRSQRRVAITVLHGLRGVGKTTLAAAYAECHRENYRAIWWIRAQSDATTRADLVGLGVRLNWISVDQKEDSAFTAMMERLRNEGGGILLIFDNAIDAGAVQPYLPRGGAARVLLTSNAHAWRGIAESIEIRQWPTETGADYLMARTGRQHERAAAEELSVALGGLPLAHEQAAAYCERLEVSLAEYHKRFDASPIDTLDDDRHAPPEYHDGRTVAKTFMLAFLEAIKVHPGVGSLVVCLSVLAAEPIPIYFFVEGFEEELKEALAIKGDDLREAIAALRSFALINRDSIIDEHDSSIATDCISMHRLVREVALESIDAEKRNQIGWMLIGAMAKAYPAGDFSERTELWPRARRLDAIASALVNYGSDLPTGVAASNFRMIVAASKIRNLNQLALYRQEVLGDYAEARRYLELALTTNEKELDVDSPFTGVLLNNLGALYRDQGNSIEARKCFGNALRLYEKVEPNSPNLAMALGNFGSELKSQGDHAEAQSCFERALAILKGARDGDDPRIAIILGKLGLLQWERDGSAVGQTHLERAVAIFESALGPDHPFVAAGLLSLGGVIRDRGDLAQARKLLERALAIREKAFGPDHPYTAVSLNDLGLVLLKQSDFTEAQSRFERALQIFEKRLEFTHPNARAVARNIEALFDQLGLQDQAEAIRKKFGSKDTD